MTFQIDAFQNDAFQHVHVITGPSARSRASGKSRSTKAASRKNATDQPSRRSPDPELRQH